MNGSGEWSQIGLPGVVMQMHMADGRGELPR